MAISNEPQPPTSGWNGTLSNFFNLSLDSFVSDLSLHHQICMLEPPSQSQIGAWKNCFSALQSYLPIYTENNPTSLDWKIIFEYVLPRERGRRPDVVLLSGKTILVLEYKDYSYATQAHIDQVSAYVRDLANYHSASHNHPIFPILVLTQASNHSEVIEDVHIISSDQLSTTLQRLVQETTLESINLESWLNADYAPLPSLVAAARSIFNHDPLPFIRRAQSAGIPTTVSHLVTIAKTAQITNSHHLALVTGVPGAGKTLVGLQFVYDNHFKDQDSQRTAVFLSGNGPLVEVLQHALHSSVFVQDVHGFLRQYGGNSNFIPAEHIFVFDEAQRAWDADRVQEKRGHSNSEPQDFLQIGEKKPWSMMIGLIGDGQEIHLGEEAGLQQWNTAISGLKQPWIVHCPSKVSKLFTSASQIDIDDSLNLNTSLRSYLAGDLQTWVEHLLNGKIDDAAQLAKEIYKQKFDIYITDNLTVAKNYTLLRYTEQEDKRYGLLASSKAKNLTKYDIHNEYQWSSNLKKGPWYNDPPNSKFSCCQFHDVATEFSCQGLELDFPIIAWGDDLRWVTNRWVSPPVGPRNQAHDPHQLRLNSYRVLLTRGRDGLIIYCPPESNMKSTFDAIRQSGVINLP